MRQRIDLVGKHELIDRDVLRGLLAQLDVYAAAIGSEELNLSQWLEDRGRPTEMALSMVLVELVNQYTLQRDQLSHAKNKLREMGQTCFGVEHDD